MGESPTTAVGLVGVNVNAQSFCIPLTDLAGLTTTETNPTSGDGREVARILIEIMASRYLALEPTARPVRMTVNKANPQGIGIDQVRQSYIFNFDVSVSNTTASLVPEA